MLLDVDTERRAIALFQRLIEPGARDTRDAQLSQTDPAVAQRVRAMLARHQSATERLEAPWQQEMARVVLPAMLGPFRLLHELGRGGMGVVALGERHAAGFVQRVAIKLIPAWHVDSTRRARFLFEREVVARLQHPHIAQLVDGGEGPGGELWYAMDVVEGADLPRHCDQQGLDLRARVSLLLDLCEAVAHAHRHSILHRDIKPGNVLVTAEGQLKLIDFGIAKALDVTDSDLTQDAAPMTPRYAAPEQLRGERPTTASDQWQLGALAYEVLTGQIARQSADAPIVAPSRCRFAPDVAAARGLDPAALSRRLRGDLDSIIMKALRNAPLDRYAGVAEFAAELRDWLAGRPVAARASERWYALRKFAATHRWAVGFATLALLALIAATAVSITAERHAREEARVANRTAELVSDMFLSRKNGMNLPSMTMRDFFSHLINTAAADRELPAASRYRLLRDLAPRAAEIGAAAASEQAARGVLELAPRLFGTVSAEVAQAHDTLTLIALVARGRAAAEEMQAHVDAAASIYATLGMEQHVDFLGHLRTRARLQFILGQREAMLQTARDMVAKAVGNPDLSVSLQLQARVLLASAYEANDRLDLAAAEGDRAVAEGEALLRTQPSFAGTVEWLRSSACDWHARANAEIGLARCEALLKQLDAEGKVDSKNGHEVLLALGTAQGKLGRSEAALATYRRAERALIAVEGAESRSPAMASTQRRIGARSFALGRYDDAEAAQRHSLDISSAFMGTDHPDTLEVRMELADTLLALKRPTDALAVLPGDMNLAQLSEPQHIRWDALRRRVQESTK